MTDHNIIPFVGLKPLQSDVMFVIEGVRATIGSEAEASQKYKYKRKSQLTPKTDRMSKEINNQSN